LAQFREHVTSLIGKSIRLGRGGPDGTQGVLVAVKLDYLTLLSEDGSLVHYPVHHLRSITELVNAEPDEDLDLSGDAIDALPDTLQQLLQAYTGLKVQVYDHGPENAAGIVFGTGDDFVKLITSPDEMVHYPFFHIRSVRLARLPQQNQNKDNDEGGGNQGKSGQGKSGQGKSGQSKSGQGGRRGQSGSGNRNRRRNRNQTGSDQTGGGGRRRSRGQTGGRNKGQTGGRNKGQTGGRNKGQTGGRNKGQTGGRKSGK
jgi:spore coat protein B